MLKFEDKIDVINELLEKHRYLWRLNSISYVDYDDICQIIRLHIYNKWDKWDQTRPLENWAATIITNQIKNAVRNTYTRLAPPCNSCPFNGGGNTCLFTSSGSRDNTCEAFEKWATYKQTGYNLKLPTSLDTFSLENNGESLDIAVSGDFDIEKSVKTFHKYMLNTLPFKLALVYEILYINDGTDEDVARVFKFKGKNKKRISGYRQIFNMKNKIQEIARESLDKFDMIYE